MGGSCALQEDVSCRARIDDQLRELGNGSVANVFELQVEGCRCSFISKLVVVDTYYYCNSMSLLAEGVEKKCNKGTMVHWCSPVGPISPQGAGLAWGCQEDLRRETYWLTVTLASPGWLTELN